MIGWKCYRRGGNPIPAGEILYLGWGGGVGDLYIHGEILYPGWALSGEIPYPGLCHPRCSQKCSNASWGKRFFLKKKGEKRGERQEIKKKKMG